MKRMLMAGAAVLLLSAPAMAWDYNQKGNHNQQIGDGATGTQNNNSARSHSSSHSVSKAAGGSATGTGGAVSNNVNVGGGGGSGGTPPTMFVPDGAGQASCGGGIGLGGVGLAGGGSGGGSLFEFGECKIIRESTELRAIAAETHNPDIEQAALNELCQIDRVRDAFGGTCPRIHQPKAVLETKKYPYDYCETRNAGDWNQHEECDRMRVDLVNPELRN